jgi:DNA-directed RNA polymerase specialized sigma24 family protein
LDGVVSSKLDKVQTLMDIATNPCSRITGMPRNPSPNLQPISAIIARIADIEKEIEEDIDALVDYKQDVVDVIMHLDPLQRDVVKMRYILFKTWSAIADELQLTVRHVHRVHNAALMAIDGILQQRKMSL